MLTGHKLAQYITGMEMTQRDSEFWRAQNNLAKSREGYETLQSLFEKTMTTPTATTRVLNDIWNNRTAQDTAYSPETTNDHHERQTKSQGRVERRLEVGEKGSKSNGKVDEKVTTATGLGKGATDHKAGGVSLIKPTSSQENVPGTHIDTPSPPPPLTTPTLPVEQPAPASKRPTHQRSRDGHVPKNGTH
ncbi:hypothetical protein BDN67DRAFT_982463 [Paxillus ammoniavirescens]|nr:hypothetical protein BDN67DRAFT_982463 [Paxillus ammoniavirescens]